jgi:hypothetical protein
VKPIPLPVEITPPSPIEEESGNSDGELLSE